MSSSHRIFWSLAWLTRLPTSTTKVTIVTTQQPIDHEFVELNDECLCVTTPLADVTHPR